MEKELLEEFWALGLEELKTVMQLYELKGDFINLDCRLPNGQTAKLLDDEKRYYGAEVCKRGSERCYGLAADEGRLWCMNTATAARTRSWLSGSAAADRKIGRTAEKSVLRSAPWPFLPFGPAPGARIIMGDDD